jgi:hypothetical protein
MALCASVKNVEFYVRNVRMRMPFKFGMVTLRAAACLHVQMDVEMADGSRALGEAGDMLAPKWFDKDPTKDHADNMWDLIKGAQAAAIAYQEASKTPCSVFETWQQGYAASMAFGDEAGLNHLAAGNGSALMERALIDAVGKASGKSYFDLLKGNMLGIDLEQIHGELAGVELYQVIAPAPLETLQVRHTIGLTDPLRTADIAPQDRLDDGLPQSVEEYIERHGIRYLKIKVNGQALHDYERLKEIAAILDRDEAPYYLSLDGNEQYKEIDGFLDLLARLEGDAGLQRFYQSILFIEQPLDRSISLDPDLAAGIRAVSARRPMLIDESDEDIDSFRQAISLGYKGVSSKACKGFIKALTNQALVRYLNVEGEGYFLSGEDLTNTPVVPLHQDLTHLAALGITHAERNGHHYVKGLDHLSAIEQAECRAEHGRLYRQEGEGLVLDIHDGTIDLTSLQRPGLGVGVETDTAAMMPLDAWTPETLE